MLDLRRMMLLCDLADLGTVAAVAEHRNITSSAVSQQLRVLEQETGAVLFRRHGRTLGLTQSGEILVEHVRRVMGAVEEAMSAVAASRDTVGGQLTVAGFETSIPSLAAPLVQRLSRDEPYLHVRVIQEGSATALHSLRRGEIDVALIYRLYFLADETVGGLVSRPLFHDPLVLLAPAHLHERIHEKGLSARPASRGSLARTGQAGPQPSTWRVSQRALCRRSSIVSPGHPTCASSPPLRWRRR
jgi:DNA-binding transcriptional LysR family regulator